MNRISVLLTLAFAVAAPLSRAQDATGSLEGQVADSSGGAISGAIVAIRNLRTDLTQTRTTGSTGFYKLGSLPAGQYSLTVEATNFAKFLQEPINILVSQTARADVHLQPRTVTESVIVQGDAQQVDTSTNTLGNTVSGREVVDLPLNGRNFTQLGLLQTGVAPVTAGVLKIGGTLREGQAYSVNGQRPESNNYLLDGMENNNRVDGGFAIKVPVDSIVEFRILTHTAPPEFGGYSGSTTSVVTKGGGNKLSGTLYEFFRNDHLDARNFFSRSVEPLKQNQFGGNTGGALVKDRLFFFGYYEGFRNRQGFTQSAAVPTAAQKMGDYSAVPIVLRNNAAGGAPFPDSKIPSSMFSPIGQRIIQYYPNGNVSPSVHSETVVTSNENNQAGGRIDFNRTPSDLYFARYSFSKGNNINPISVRGAPVPGFPTQDDLTGNSAIVSNTRILSPSMTNSLRVSFFRYDFQFDQRLNRTSPRDLGFNYDSASALGQGPPFFNVSGYSPIGGAQSGPRLSVQNTYEAADSLSWFRGAHSLKVGFGFRRNQINVFQATVPNGLLIFTPAGPINDSFANLLIGSPQIFFQGLGDFYRGLRNWGTTVYAQDEWRASRRLTINYGVRWEAINPMSEIRNRLNGFLPGVRSKIRPEAPIGVVFPGDDGVGDGIAHNYYKAFMPRFGMVFDPTGSGQWSIRAGYGMFYDPFSNGANIGATFAVSATPWVRFNQFAGNVNFANPYSGSAAQVAESFARPSTMLAMDPEARPAYAQDWNFSIQRSIFKSYVLEGRYVGTKGTRLPRTVERNPAIFGPGATSGNADRRRIYADCPPDGSPCRQATAATLVYGSNSSYNAAQVSLTHRYAAGFAFNVSYWFSKSIDYLSGMNLNLTSAQALAGENDLAQNPFDLRAERGLSLFDARHRFVGSGLWELPIGRRAKGLTGALISGWQINGILTANTGTPFTVYDTANVALQASSPPITGYAASRPDLVGDPNAGPRTVEAWMDRSGFRRLVAATEAGKFGNAGRNIARGPGFINVDVSAMKNLQLTERVRLQFRAEGFNIANHANFGLPISDLASPNYGRILSASQARLGQLALKLMF
jgi:hypothetical protein